MCRHNIFFGMINSNQFKSSNLINIKRIMLLYHRLKLFRCANGLETAWATGFGRRIENGTVSIIILPG